MTQSDKKLSITKNISNKNEMNNESNKYIHNEMNNSNSRDKRRYDELKDVVNKTDKIQKVKANSAKHSAYDMYNLKTKNYFAKLSSSVQEGKNVTNEKYLNENTSGIKREMKPYRGPSIKTQKQKIVPSPNKIPKMILTDKRGRLIAGFFEDLLMLHMNKWI